MSDTIHHDSTPPSAEPPGGGRQDHETMRSAAMHPINGPADANVAAGGGLTVPGGEAHPELAAQASSSEHGGDAPGSPAPREPIPGERDPSTMMHREPGAVGGQFSGAMVPSPDTHQWLDDRTAQEHAREGGGGAVRKPKDSHR